MSDKLKEYMKKLESIREERLMSKLSLASELKISYITLMKLYKGNHNASYKTMRSLKEFIEANTFEDER